MEEVKVVSKDLAANVLKDCLVLNNSNLAFNKKRTLSNRSLDLLRKEVCKDTDPGWKQKRTEFLTAGVASRTLSRRVFGAGGYGSCFQLLRWYIDETFRTKEQNRLDRNPYCIHGRKYQAEAASLYSNITGFTLSPLGMLTGPLPASKDFEEVPDFISATFDFVCLEEPIIVEVKCPQSFHDDWKRKYWVQCQHQLQLARFQKLHLVIYIPRSSHDLARVQIEEIIVDNKWFRQAVPSYIRFWKLLKDSREEHAAEIIRRVKKRKRNYRRQN